MIPRWSAIGRYSEWFHSSWPVFRGRTVAQRPHVVGFAGRGRRRCFFPYETRTDVVRAANRIRDRSGVRGARARRPVRGNRENRSAYRQARNETSVIFMSGHGLPFGEKNRLRPQRRRAKADGRVFARARPPRSDFLGFFFRTVFVFYVFDRSIVHRVIAFSDGRESSAKKPRAK